jgi:hypothetical protein
MAYTDKESFLKDFKAAQEMAVEKYGQFCKPVKNDVAWSAYTNSGKKSTLGLMLFGRHVGSMKAEVNRRAQEGFQHRQKVINDKDAQLKGKRMVPSFYRKQVTQKATAANFALMERKKLNVPAAIDTDKSKPMMKNFGVVNNNDSGSILLMGDTNWNLTINDTWLLGAVHSYLPFYPASAVSRANIFEDKHVLSITGRELLGLAVFGYRQVIPEYEELGSAFKVDNYRKAAGATLIKYQDLMNGLNHATAAEAFEKAGFRIVEVGI